VWLHEWVCFVCVSHRFAPVCVCWLRCVSVPSPDSRPELCSTDTHCLRCVGCIGTFTLWFFESDLRLPFTPLWSSVRSFIDAAIQGMNLGPCGEYLERRPPKIISKLFEITQEYCKSDRGKRRRIEEMNEQKKARNSDRSHSKPWHAD